MNHTTQREMKGKLRALAEPIARMANKQDECTGRFWEGRFKAQRIIDEAGLLACSMYVDLNPVRAAMADSPDDSVQTSAYDRIEAGKGKQIASAAFDLLPVSTEQAGVGCAKPRSISCGKKRRAKRRHPTGRKIRRDGWLAPLELDEKKLSSQAQAHTGGPRSSDRGFLNVSLRDYLRLLRWTAKQSVEGVVSQVPKSLAKTLKELGIDAGMWRDLVWHWQKYFGQSTCVGRPESMRAEAERTGHHGYRGQASAAACLA